MARIDQGSPFAPERFPTLPAVRGVRLAAAAAGVRYQGRLDVMLAEIAPGSAVAGVFTTSRTRAAPVLWCEARLAERRAGERPDGPLAFLANAGNANAFTGRNGAEGAERMAASGARAVGGEKQGVFVASTGVIGEPLPVERIVAVEAQLAAGLAAGDWEHAARAIMTTDTFPKGAGAVVEIDGVDVRIAGFAKGSGMIAPDMATMLAFVFTDAAVAEPLLQKLLAEEADRSFNAITVDGDTSTSDTLLLAATGASGAPPIETTADPRLPAFREALASVLRDLAHLVVKDGEGATKFAAVTVTGAESERAARRIGLSIANSPLVKTALAGEDPNWGRIVMAVGKSGEAADRDRLSIRFGDILVAENGWVAPGYREADGAAYMKRAELEIVVDVGVGDASATVWTCDLTARYVAINADYRS
ncbi:MAG: bifunctional glutamate N-acetyltransferase/amino-acid acetyltransferase ArgJ [Rhodobacteraceae bacterium]|nr:MAG: bifunctional glutamate N-acetyltransferase/amino-acid acetyltransferase ArgJ [Paracoccaceae bacterium]